MVDGAAPVHLQPLTDLLRIAPGARSARGPRLGSIRPRSPPGPSDRRPRRSGGVPYASTEIARSLSAEPTVLATLQRIVDMAADTIEGCDGAGLLLVTKRKIVVGAWSNELVHEVESMEYEIAEGPCIDAIWERPTFESSDLRDQVSLWPTFAAHALDAGIESMLAFRLFASEETLGALDLYSGRRGAFDESARAFGTVFAAHAA